MSSEQKDPIDVYVEMALKEMEEIVGDKEVTPQNVLLLTLSLEKIVESYKTLKGEQKKQVVVNTFTRYLNARGGDKYNALQLLPSFIDISVTLDRGHDTIKNSFELYTDMALKELEEIVGEQEITPSNVLLLALSLERVVQKYEKLDGPQRKQLVMKVFTRYLKSHGGDKYGALQILPSFIDVSVSLDKGEVGIKMDIEDVALCCAGFLSRKKKN